MQHLIFEFATDREMKETVKILWEQHNVSGEMSIRPITGGRWRVEINSEKDIRESSLEKFTAYMVEAGD